MIGGEFLRRRLGELARSRRGGVHAASEDAAAPPSETIRHAQLGVDAYLKGGEWSDQHGSVFVHERLRSEIERPRPEWGRLGTPPEDEPALGALHSMGLGRVLFLDLETGGFGPSLVFLAGTMHWSGSDFVIRQYFARHYGEERTLLAVLDAEARQFECLVTFNGKTYDVPFLRDRARVHRVPLNLPAGHVDLLHPARRRWRHRLNDCRLKTLELHVCRRRRVGDVASDEVPALYHDFVRRGDPYRLIPVFHHNLLDVITMHGILSALCAPPRAPSAQPGGVWLDTCGSQEIPDRAWGSAGAGAHDSSLTCSRQLPIIRHLESGSVSREQHRFRELPFNPDS